MDASSRLTKRLARRPRSRRGRPAAARRRTTEPRTNPRPPKPASARPPRTPSPVRAKAPSPRPPGAKRLRQGSQALIRQNAKPGSDGPASPHRRSRQAGIELAEVDATTRRLVGGRRLASRCRNLPPWCARRIAVFKVRDHGHAQFNPMSPASATSRSNASARSGLPAWANSFYYHGRRRQAGGVASLCWAWRNRQTRQI